MTPAQILAIYNAGTPIDLLTLYNETNGMIGWWRMGDKSVPGSLIPNQTLTPASLIPINIPASQWKNVTP